jgi:hypothetical protein
VQAISEVLCCGDGIVSGPAEIRIAEDDAPPAYLIDPVAVLSGSGTALKVELPGAYSQVSSQSVDAVVSGGPFPLLTRTRCRGPFGWKLTCYIVHCILINLAAH